MRVVKVKKPLEVDMIIRETMKCKKPIEVCLKAGGMLQPIASYTRKEFLGHLQRFRKGLEPPNRQYEELTLALNINKTIVEFHAKPRP